jgi:lipopolysaccharide export system protein LptA
MKPVRRRSTVRTAAILAALAMAPSPAAAQGLTTQGGDAPVTIHATDGIEWDRDARKYIARGDAVATRNQATVRADVLTAFYRDKDGGDNQDVFRVDATGNVRITANDQTVFGDRGVYHVDKAVFVLKGKNLRFLSEQGTLTARDSLEYWEQKRLAVARVKAMLVKDDKRLNADILTAHLVDKNDPGGKRTTKKKTSSDKRGQTGAADSEVRQVDAFGNVHISLRKAIVRGDRGVYIPKTSIATICGNVRVTSGKNQLNGECAEVNLNTSIYRLTGRAQGLVIPKKKKGR